jgi:hypothetical protein
MNYLAHGRLCLDDPYQLAGTAAPDWLSVVDRKARVRTSGAEGLIDDDDPRLAAFARGVMRHHFDDNWFHRTRAFAESSLELTVLLRDALPEDRGFRPSFLGHILVELLLDARLAADNPGMLDDYYRAVGAVDPAIAAQAAERIAGRPIESLATFIEKFAQMRFLWDYAENAKLLVRLNQVMRRVGLSPLPDAIVETFGSARRIVDQRSAELLSGG